MGKTMVKKAMLFGFMLGDGWLSKKDNKNSFQCGFSGEPDGLYIARNYLLETYKKIGKARVYTRNTESPTYNIKGTTTSMVVNVSIAKDFYALGMPIGKRVENEFLLPQWITDGEFEIKKAFISGFYCAEGYTPSMQKNDKTPKPFGMSITKRAYMQENFKELIAQFSHILNELNIAHSIKFEYTFTCDYNIKCSFIFGNELNNLINICQTLELDFAIDKYSKMIQLYAYLIEKKKILYRLDLAYKEAIYGLKPVKYVSQKYDIPETQIRRWRERKTGYRIPGTFPTLSQFVKNNGSL